MNSEAPVLFAPLSSAPEMAQILNVSTKTIYYWVERNEIPYVKVGKHLRFNAKRVIDHFETKTLESRPSCVRAAEELDVLLANSSLKSSLKPRINRTSVQSGQYRKD